MAETEPSARPRRRRSAENARREILDAAQKRLVQGGPEALRLQDIAADVGISHPAIVHHFGSRDGLVQALVERHAEELRDDLIRILGDPEAEYPASVVLDRVFATLGDRGNARLMAWRALSGQNLVARRARIRPIRDLATLLHGMRSKHARGAQPPEYEDSVFAVRLAALAMFGEAIIGQAFTTSDGRAPSAKSRERFRNWLAQLLLDHLSLD